ncbi:molybdopterin-dependent oxidoreductase [Undibacterium sp. TJN25]|uniref:molybdopterin-dependent oxidoreductase n=1 Tax=Undibacterium sp. TJN25 TaxID=3413056 RepID=UPI003BF12E30
MTRLIRALLLSAAATFCGHALAAGNGNEPSKLVTDSITVSGNVENKLVLKVEDLRAFPPQQISEVQLLGRGGANMGKLSNVKGVRLRDILEKAVVIAKDHNDVKKTVIIAAASDGYKVVYSWSEVFNSPLGDGVLVYFEKNGAALGDDEGRIAMISAKDTNTGPRHVKWLQSLEVKKIAD